LKKLGIILVLLLVASIFISGCASNKGNITNNTSGAQGAPISNLRIGFQPSTHQIAYMTAASKGWWQHDLAPYGVQSVEEHLFQTGPPEMTAMLSGQLDVAYVGAAPFLIALANNNLDAKIVAAVQVNGSSLVLEPGTKYNSPQDLKNTSITTYPPGSIQDTLLRKWLTKNGLNPQTDLNIIGLPSAGDSVTAVVSNKAQGSFLPHPYPTIIEKQLNGSRIVVQSGEMEPNHVCCVLVVSGKLIREHPDIVEQIVKTHINATNYDNQHIDEAAQIFTNKTNIDLDTVKASLKEWDGRWITDPSVIENSTIDFSNTLYQMKNINKQLTKEDIFDTSFYEKATNGK
jgi:NitT/TauT family transport system substrate-binding protein